MIGRLVLTAGVVGALGAIAIAVNYVEVWRKETDTIRATFESAATAQSTATQQTVAQMALGELSAMFRGSFLLCWKATVVPPDESSCVGVYTACAILWHVFLIGCWRLPDQA